MSWRRSPMREVSTVTPGWKLIIVELWNQKTNSGWPTLSLQGNNMLWDAHNIFNLGNRQMITSAHRWWQRCRPGWRASLLNRGLQLLVGEPTTSLSAFSPPLTLLPDRCFGSAFSSYTKMGVILMWAIFITWHWYCPWSRAWTPLISNIETWMSWDWFVLPFP